LEHLIALYLLTYIAGAWLGEAFRDVVCGRIELSSVPVALLTRIQVDANAHPKWLLYSGLFVLLKQKLRLLKTQIEVVPRAAASAFAVLIYGDV
jgi:hypothetical protein